MQSPLACKAYPSGLETRRTVISTFYSYSPIEMHRKFNSSLSQCSKAWRDGGRPHRGYPTIDPSSESFPEYC